MNQKVQRAIGRRMIWSVNRRRNPFDLGFDISEGATLAEMALISLI